MKTIYRLIRTETITRAKHALELSLLIALGLLLPGCKHNANTPIAEDLAGVYSLSAVNGLEVPAKVSHEGTDLEVRSGTFTIRPDGTCSVTTVFAPTGRPEVTREMTATYTQDGSKLTMRWKGAGVTTGTVEGNRFTMNNEGILFAYTK